MPKNKQPTVYPRILVLEGLWSDTSDAVRAAGGTAKEVYPWDWGEVEEELLSGEYDGMILTGGSDINPNIYGAKPDPACYGIDKLRDAVELMALGHALDHKLPVLGICRGSQMMCAATGGTLKQDIDGHRNGRHWVKATPSATTFKRAINNQHHESPVTSLHHQCVDTVGKGMRIAARALDGTPEAIESMDGLLLGCQFHPELEAFTTPQAFNIFRWLVNAAAQRAGGRAPRRTFRNASKTASRFDRYDDMAWRLGGAVELYNPAEVRETSSAQGSTSSGASGATADPPRASRKAGEPAIPSMRTPVEEGLIREGKGYTDGTTADSFESGSSPLSICPICALIFDTIGDRIDHVKYLHGYDAEPPAGDPAWDAEADAFEVPFGTDTEQDSVDQWLQDHGYPRWNPETETFESM